MSRDGEVAIERKVFNELEELFKDKNKASVSLKLQGFCGVKLVRIKEKNKIYMCSNCRDEFELETDLELHMESSEC